MSETTTLQQFIDTRFGGVIKSGKHAPDAGACCALEALNACHDRPWTDDPQIARCFDLRRLNDARWSSDALRTQHLVPVVAAYDGSLDWPKARQKAVVKTIVIRLVQEIVSALPGRSAAVVQQCKEATTLAAAYAAAYAADAAYTYGAAAAAAADAADAASAYAYAAAAAAAYAYAAAAADAAAAASADAAAAAAADAVLITACGIWLAAAA